MNARYCARRWGLRVCALKYFAELGVDYDFTTGENADWWSSRMVQETLKQQAEGQ